MNKIILGTDYPIVGVGVSAAIREYFEDRLRVEVVKLNNELLPKLTKKECDVLILNLRIFDRDGIKLLNAAIEKVPTLLFTAVGDFDTVKILFENGLSGFVQTNRSTEELITAIKQVGDERLYLDEQFKRYLFLHETPTGFVHPQKLTTREVEVAKMMLEGKALGDIGRWLNLKPSTISTFKSKIYQKLGVKNIFELEKVKYILSTEYVGKMNKMRF